MAKYSGTLGYKYGSKGFLNPGQGEIDRQNQPDSPGSWGYTPPVAGGGAGGSTTTAPPAGYGGSGSDIASRLAGSSDPNQAIGETITEGFRLRDEEDKRYGDTLGFLQNEWGQANKPSLSEDTIRQMYSRDADRIHSGALGDFSNLRTYLGGAGITGGGLAAGLGAQIQMQAMGQLRGSRRDLTIAKASADANDTLMRWQRSMGLGEFKNQSPSMLGLDTLGSATDTKLGMYLGDKQVEAAREGAAATKSAGKSSMFGSILGGALGAIGGLL